MKAAFSSLIFLFLFVFKSYAQPVFFETYWGGSSNDFARSVRQLSNGDIYVFGFSNAGSNGAFDYALNKLDRYGNLKWTKYYGDSLDDNGLYMNTTADGNFIAVGESYSSISDLDIQVYKIDTSGAVLWSKRYGTSSVNESAKFITETSDGGYVLCGYRTDASGFNDSYVIKTNSVGDTLWTKMVGGVDNDYSDAVREMPDGNYLVTADTKSFGAGGYDVELFTLNAATGNVIWDYPYGDSLNSGCQGVAISQDKHILSWGETETYQFSPFDFLIQKMDTAGNLTWKKSFGGIKTDAAFSLSELPDKSMMFTGYSNSYNSGPIDLVVFKTDSSGNLKWIQDYGDVGIDIGYEIIPSVYNGFLICGQTFRGSDDFYLLHLDMLGLISGMPHESAAENIFSVYPNPSSGIMAIGAQNNSSSNTISYKVFNVMGEMISFGLIGNNALSLNGIIPPGIYFLELKEGDHAEMKKIVISRK